MNIQVFCFRYQAIQFGSEMMGKGLVIVDKESGKLLGGKRAAIQFYHDKQNKETGGVGM